MEKHEREKQALAELDRAFGDNLAKAGQAMNQSGAAKESTTPYEEFKQLISQMQATARQQQLKTEQTIQQTLQQAATALADAQKTDLITQQILVAQQALNQQGPNNNPQYYSQVLKQLQTQVQEQLHQTDQRVAQSLQQTVSSLAQSQEALFDSQAFSQVYEMIRKCEKTLQQWQNSSGNPIH